MHPPWPLVIALLVAVPLLTACGEDGSPPAADTTFNEAASDLTVAQARAVRTVPLYWLGKSFEGLPLVAILGDGENRATFIYGTCEPSAPRGGRASCAPPLSVQTVRMCAPTVRRAPLGRRQTLRGVPVGSGGGGLVVLTRDVDVIVFGSGGQGVRAIRAMRAVNPAAPGAVGAGEPLPDPPPSAERRTPCPAQRLA